jgi:hypothetical protein
MSHRIRRTSSRPTTISATADSHTAIALWELKCIVSDRKRPGERPVSSCLTCYRTSIRLPHEVNSLVKLKNEVMKHITPTRPFPECNLDRILP